MEFDHAVAVVQSLILITVATGRRSRPRDCWVRASPVRSTGELCCATVILYWVVPKLGVA
jgi:hypothetical protein